MNDKDEIIVEVKMPKGWDKNEPCVKCVNSFCRCYGQVGMYGEVPACPLTMGKPLSRHPAPAKEEPLAVLADRKGFNVECDRATYNEWRLILFQYIRGKEISSHIADTYAEAEAKARAYLEGLPDVDKEGR